MKVYLLNPPYYPHFGREMRWQDTGRGGTLYYPIWLSYAAGLLEKNNHKIKLVDCPAWNWSLEDVLKDLEKFKPDMVVISTSFTSINNDLRVCDKIKRSYPETNITVVGPPTSQFYNDIIKNHHVDFVARYEYDFTLLDLCDALETGRDLDKILGITYKNNSKVKHNPDRPWSSSSDLDLLPFVSKIYKKYLNINDYFLNYSLYPMVQIFTGRGCPYKCTFCSWPQSFMGRKYRTRRIENIINELEWIEKNLPKVKEVFFEDDTFTISKKRVAEFCKLYREYDLNIKWSCNARVDTLDLETMKEMKRANCRFLIVGFESANNTILKNIKKGFTVEQAREFAKNVKKAGLFLHADFIIGLPGETKETIENTIKFINEIMPEQLQVSVSSPFPGTELYEWYKQNNYLLTDDPNEYLDEQGHQKAIISYPWLTNEEIVAIVDKILKEYYMSYRYIPIVLKQILRKDGYNEAKRLIKSVKMFLDYIYKRKREK